MKWPVIPAVLLRVVVRRIVPPLLAALVGMLLDAGLLDGQLGAALVGLLS